MHKPPLTPDLDPDDIVLVWQRRRERYVLWNRRWIIAVFVWLALAGAAVLGGYFGPPRYQLLLGVSGGAIFVCGFGVFQMAAMTVGWMLRCPACGKRVDAPWGRVREVTRCPNCNASFRFAADRHEPAANTF